MDGPTTPETIPEAPPEWPLAPEFRARPGAAGVPLTIDGHAWLLAHAATARGLDRLRDAIFDALAARGTVPAAAVLQVAWTLLAANYRLDDGELAGLIVAADRADARGLAAAVLDALFGPEEPRWGYSQWARVSLHANGIDPAKVPPADVPALLAWLVQSGRAPAAAEFIPAARARAEREKFQAIVRRLGARPEADPAAPPVVDTPPPEG